MKVVPTALPGVLLVEPRVIPDARGWFAETWRSERYAAHGLPAVLVQDNLVSSGSRVLRGLHLQHPEGQGKLVQVLVGAVFDVAVDVRRGSPTYGRWVGERLDDRNHRQLWIPPGFAHGYQVLGDGALVAYKCSAPYRQESELTVRFDDPALGIPWPVADPVVSEKDRAARRLAEIDPSRLPPFGGEV